jgi:hypothetical protein
VGVACRLVLRVLLEFHPKHLSDTLGEAFEVIRLRVKELEYLIQVHIPVDVNEAAW